MMIIIRRQRGNLSTHILGGASCLTLLVVICVYIYIYIYIDICI